MKSETYDLDSLDKAQLHALCDLLLTCSSDAIEESVAFLEAKTFGIWHGRARAMIARRLKHCRLSQRQRERIVRSILSRFVSGRFSEQYKDQLRLVLHLDRERAFSVARS